MFWLTNTLVGTNLTEQVEWFRPAVLWSGITLICICAALCVGEMLADQALYIWFWPLIAVFVSSAGNIVLGEPSFTPGVIYEGLIALITITVIRVRSTRQCAKF